MNKEKLIRIAEKRRQEYLKKEEEADKIARKVQKGMATIRDMYLTFNTPECGEDKDIDVFIENMGGEHPFSANVLICEDSLGSISIGYWGDRHESVAGIKIGSRNSVSSPERILKAIKSESRHHLEWIFLHADEFCDMVIAELEKQYEDNNLPKTEEGKEDVPDMATFEKVITRHGELEPCRDLLAKLIRESGGDLVHYLDDYCSNVMVGNLLLPDMIAILNSSSYYGSIRVFQTIEEYCQYLLSEMDMDWDALSSVIHHFIEQCRQLNGSYGGEFIKVDLSGDLTDVRLISLEQLRKDYCKAVHGEGGQDVIISSYELLNVDETISLYAKHYKAIHKFWNEYNKESHAG